jgi:hypothetical protein
MTDEHSPQDAVSTRREAAVDDLGRAAGAALRQSAPADGVDRITRTVRRQRIVRASAALATVTAVVVIGLVVLRKDDDAGPAAPAPTRPAPTTPAETTPVTDAVTLVVPARGVALRDELPVRATRMIGFSPDARYLLMPTGSSIDRYDATTMAFVDVLPCDRFPPDDTSRDAAIAEARSLATRFAANACGVYGYSPDGTRAVNAGDASASVIDVASGDTLGTLPLPGSAGYPALGRYTPDGALIMTWGVHATVAWDATTFEQRFVLEGDDGGPASVFTGLTFSDDSRLVAGASHDSAVVWDASNGSKVLRVPAQQLIQGAVLSPDGALLAVSGRQGDNAVYDVASGTKIWEFDAELHDIVGHDPSITYMAFSPDVHTLVVCYWNGTEDVVRRYDIGD